MMAPNHKSSEVAMWRCQESLQGLASSENVNILDLVMIEKIPCVEICKQNEFSLHEIVKKRKKNMLWFCCHLILPKVTSSRDKCLVKMEKALNNEVWYSPWFQAYSERLEKGRTAVLGNLKTLGIF